MATASRPKARKAPAPKPVSVFLVPLDALQKCVTLGSEMLAAEFEETHNALERSAPTGFIAVADVFGLAARPDAVSEKCLTVGHISGDVHSLVSRSQSATTPLPAGSARKIGGGA